MTNILLIDVVYQGAERSTGGTTLSFCLINNETHKRAIRTPYSDAARTTRVCYDVFYIKIA